MNQSKYFNDYRIRTFDNGSKAQIAAQMTLTFLGSNKEKNTTTYESYTARQWDAFQKVLCQLS